MGGRRLESPCGANPAFEDRVSVTAALQDPGQAEGPLRVRHRVPGKDPAWWASSWASRASRAQTGCPSLRSVPSLGGGARSGTESTGLFKGTFWLRLHGWRGLS